ncbi:NAD-dependent epimerase/dehydratase family protein [Lichenicoccus sp.]|uniref:NAD-dependent epimerase/dehydratase family protein n=1 Tax=Lichenicoccus sp. TaxID=2781899 RepID=UPI003D0D40E5
MSERICITGGAGFVGRLLAREFYNRHDVLVLDRLDFGINRFRPEELSRFELSRTDLRDAAGVAAALDRFAPDVIVHLAAAHFIPLCERAPGSAVETNVVGTANLLMACPPNCRFVFASSGAVYAPSQALHDESRSEIGPREVYGFTKLQGEQYVRYFAKLRGIASVVVRLFNVVGPGETNPHLLPEIVAQMKSGHTQVALGNLWPKRDYIHVHDAAAGFAAVALNGTVQAGETVTVNLGTAKQYSVEEMIAKLRSVSGYPLAVRHDPGRARAVDRPFLGAVIKEIWSRFGWAPRLTVDDAIRDLWRDPDLSDDLAERLGLAPSAMSLLPSCA